MSEKKHAKLPPSGAKRWLLCPGSPALCESVVDAGSIFAEEGTAGHEAFQMVMDGADATSLVGKKASNGVELTQELIDHVLTAVEWAVNYKEETGAKLFTEHKFEIGEGMGLPAGVYWGTGDLTGLSRRELMVADLKLGYVNVDVGENEQLISYGLGALDATGWMHDQIRLVILQPKKDLGPKEIVYTAREMEDFSKFFAEGARAALAPDAPLIPSEDACEYCRAAGACPALRKELIATANREFSSLETLSGDQIADLLNKGSMIENAMKSIRNHAIRLLEIDPSYVPGFKRVIGERRRKWTDEVKAQSHFEKTIPLDVIAPRCLTTPLQVESHIASKLHLQAKELGFKLTKKAAMEEARAKVAKFTTKPEGNPTLVPESDSRQALGPAFTEADVKELESQLKGEKTLELID